MVMMKSLRGHMKGGGAEQGSMCDSADAKVIDNPPRQAELRLNLVSSSCIMPGCHGYPSSSYKKIRGVGRGCVGGAFSPPPPHLLTCCGGAFLGG